MSTELRLVALVDGSGDSIVGKGGEPVLVPDAVWFGLEASEVEIVTAGLNGAPVLEEVAEARVLFEAGKGGVDVGIIVAAPDSALELLVAVAFDSVAV